MQLRVGGGVLALAGEHLRDLAGRQLEAGLDGIQEGRLADAGRPGDDRQLAGQPRSQLLDAHASLRRRVDDRVPDLRIAAEQPLRLRLGDEVDLVGHEQHGHLVVLRHHQEPIHQPRIGRWSIACEHDGHQIGIGDHHVLAPRPARTGLPAAEPPLSRLDGVDGAGPIRQALEAHAVADDREVGRLALLLDPAAQPRLHEVTIVGQHGVEARSRSQDDAAGAAHPSAPTAMP